MRCKALGLAGAAVAAYALPAAAHHSFAMFAGDQKTTIEGTVKEFQWTNPHAWIFIMVPSTDGLPVQWAVEMDGPGSLVHQGWLPKTLVPGIKVTAVIHPLKDGTPGGQYLSITLEDGRNFGTP